MRLQEAGRQSSSPEIDLNRKKMKNARGFVFSMELLSLAAIVKVNNLFRALTVGIDGC